jgi:hypothetical protein
MFTPHHHTIKRVVRPRLPSSGHPIPFYFASPATGSKVMRTRVRNEHIGQQLNGHAARDFQEPGF